MTEPTDPPPAPAEPADPVEAARLAGRAVLAERGTPGLRYTLRVELRTPVARGEASDEALLQARELDTDTTAILAGRVGYDAINRELPAGADPVAALLKLAAAHRHPDLVTMAAWADQFTGSRVTLRVVGHHTALPDPSPANKGPLTPTGGRP